MLEIRHKIPHPYIEKSYNEKDRIKVFDTPYVSHLIELRLLLTTQNR